MLSIVRASLIAQLVKNLPPTPVFQPGGLQARKTQPKQV